jgi:hypothetical protein
MPGLTEGLLVLLLSQVGGLLLMTVGVLLVLISAWLHLGRR